MKSLPVLAAAAAFIALPAAAPAAAETSALSDVRGRLLSDKSEASIRDLAPGSPRLLLAAFSGEGGQRIRAFAPAVRKDHPVERLPLVHVVGVSKVPGMFRGVARKTLKKDIPPERHHLVLVVTDPEADEALRNLLGDQPAYVVAIDAAGAVIGAVPISETGEAPGVPALIERLLQ